ncbi:isochorismatase family protein [Jiangella aurantiaca]|uniref:Isochorismatase family protein n=1 Tax=Jiangella aurantiaca TaxID=2530373 RepID=A0A4R5ABP6_9ACTN|nr:isochorismatase family protein [Jiangella aurantiaca]TDD68616.1 isochorismatase family protein [Jiangella aurantiaca]
MPDQLELDPSATALVLVDLMDRIVGQPLAPRSGTDVVATARELAAGFRAAGAAVVLIRVERPGVAEQPPGSDLVAGLVSDGDIVVVKRTIGGFYGTELHEQLQARGVSTLVFGGIATNLGVESTARAASDLGYDLVFVAEAMTALTAPEHDAAVGLNLPRFGTVVTADAVRLTASR